MGKQRPRLDTAWQNAASWPVQEIDIRQQSKRIVRALGSRLVADNAAQESFGCGGIVEGGGEDAADQRRRLGIRRAAQFKPTDRFFASGRNASSAGWAAMIGGIARERLVGVGRIRQELGSDQPCRTTDATSPACRSSQRGRPPGRAVPRPRSDRCDNRHSATLVFVMRIPPVLLAEVQLGPKLQAWPNWPN